MIYLVIGALTTLVLQSVVHAFLFTRMLEELKASHAAALQARDLPDAARRLTRKEEDERARANIALQKEIMENGGAFKPPTPIKPEGI